MDDATDPGPKAVLIVEDNPGDARLVSFYLREDLQNPFTVIIAAKLSEALAHLGRDHVDVVLLDLSLPDSFGLDTLERLRSAAPQVPVVVLTGTNDEQLALAALRQGAQDYLVKGVGDGDVVRRAARYAIERSRVDQELRQSEARFRAVFANAGLGVAVIDAEGRIVEVNRAFTAILGFGENEVKGKATGDLLHPEDLVANQALFAEMAEGGSDSYQTQTRFFAKDGRIVWAKLTATAVRDEESGRLVFAVAVVEDITERKRLEDQMRLAATVFENTGEGLFITDARRKIVHVNRAFTDITGYADAEVLGRNPRVLSSGRHGADFYARMWAALGENGRWQGEIWDRRKSGEMFVGWQNIAAVRDAEGQISHYVAVISDITSRKEVEERLSYAANHDPLTGLPNRSLFHERLSRALARAQRNHGMVALLFIDLDRFKQVNDTLGHLVGDLLLQQVAERVSGTIRQGDTVARLAGDEFTVILEEIQDPRDVAVVAHKIVRLLAEPFDLAGQSSSISSSVGVALYPTDAGDAQTLIKLADASMYRAKQGGRNACQFHSEAVNAQAFERLVLEDALRGALERAEFLLHFQPVFSVDSGKVAAVEALLRWRHPQVGLVMPTQFIGLAEETGLVQAIGQWVLGSACAQVKAWHDAGFGEIDLGVNLSAAQLRQDGFVEVVAGALESSGLRPERLVLEIPEGGVLDRGADVAEAIARLSALGVRLAIDEFGAGFSSFTFLRRLPANVLKVAQSFVRNIGGAADDDEIIGAIVAVARGLHMTVVAPGIETEAQFRRLVNDGCDRVQGFLFARPMSAEAMGDFLRDAEVPAALTKRDLP